LLLGRNENGEQRAKSAVEANALEANTADFRPPLAALDVVG
jgi:hypothetical protein